MVPIFGVVAAAALLAAARAAPAAVPVPRAAEILTQLLQPVEAADFFKGTFARQVRPGVYW